MYVDQLAWGHKARKKTLLYIVGCKPKAIPPYPLPSSLPTHTIGSVRRASNGALPETTKREREATPHDFACWLVSLARSCTPPPASSHRVI